MLKARRLGAVAGVLLTFLVTGTALAVEQVIDGFSEAFPPPGTLLQNIPPSMMGDPPLNVFNDVDASTVTGTDVGVGGVIGGVRQLDVTITDCVFCGFGDSALVGVIPADGLLDYSTTTGANGKFELIYDAGGAGLNASLSFALGIRVSIINADPPVYPLTVMVTLASNSNMATSAMTIPMGGMPNVVLDFPFAGFTGIAGIDLDALSSIRVMVDPNGGDGAADMQFPPITTFGTPPEEPTDDCLNGEDDDNDGAVDCNDPDCVLVPECSAPAPALSPGMTALLLGVLSGIAFLGIARSRRTS